MPDESPGHRADRDGPASDHREPPDLDAALAELESTHGIEVVAARDLGSHAWNLAGPESDHDVGVVFVQDPVEYATLGEYVETIETEYHADLELSGWNVRRFAELLEDSNPTVLEFLHSPLRYRESPALTALEADVVDQFEPIAVYHHYRSLARSNYRKYLQRRLMVGDDPRWVIVAETDAEWIVRPLDEDGIDREGEAAGDGERDRERIPKGDDRYAVGTTDRTVKRNLYVLRGSLYAAYVRDTHRFPDLDFSAFLDAEGDRFPDDVVETGRDLIDQKRSGHGDRIVGDVVGPEILPPEHIDPGEHAVRGIGRVRLNEVIRAVLTE